MTKDEEKWNTTINTHFENLSNQNENITHFKYEPFDRYDLQEEEAENYDTTTGACKIMSRHTAQILCKNVSGPEIRNAELVSNY